MTLAAAKAITEPWEVARHQSAPNKAGSMTNRLNPNLPPIADTELRKNPSHKPENKQNTKHLMHPPEFYISTFRILPIKATANTLSARLQPWGIPHNLRYRLKV